MHLDPTEINVVVLLAQMVPFVLLIFILNATVFNPMLDYLEERNRRMKGFSKEAKDVDEEAENQKGEIERRLSAARITALQERTRLVQAAGEQEQNLLAATRAAAEADMAEFRKELDKARDDVAAELKSEAEILSGDMASRILGRPLAQ